MEAVGSDLPPDAVKTGMLATAAIVEAVQVPLVVMLGSRVVWLRIDVSEGLLP